MIPSFVIDVASVRAGEPTVRFSRRIEGASRRISVRMPPPLRARLMRHAHDCHTTAIMPLAQRGLLQLMEGKHRLVSHWIPDARGGRFHHIVERQVRGQARIECGSLPSHTKGKGILPTVPVSIPDALDDAVRSESRHVGKALVALADWQLTELIHRRKQITVTPLPLTKAPRA